MIYIGGDNIKNHGNKNEYLFIAYINNKKFKQLSFLLQELVSYLFPNIKDNDIINCYKNIEYEKGDICIKVNNQVKYISIKMGKRNSVHCESIEKFKKFLKEINISDQTIKEILKYNYADGTIDGTGKVRVDATHYKLENKESILNINNQLNDEAIIKKAVNRFIIQGTQKHSHKIDLLVYGTPNDFFFITPEEIYSYVLSKRKQFLSSIHFSCLTFQPLSRILDYNQELEYKRHWIQIKWYNLEDNIIELMNERAKKHLNKYNINSII